MNAWTHWLSLWDFSPGVWIACALALAGYARLSGARRDGRAAAWIAGVLVVLLALVSPIEVVGQRYLFSIHMGQHLLLAMVAPPLLIRGLPDPSVDWLLRGHTGRIIHWLVQPVIAGSLYFLFLVLWHTPAPLDYSLQHPAVYFLQHLTFLAVGLLFWWAIVIHREGESWNLTPLGEVAYLTCGAVPSVIVGLTLAMLPTAIYQGYVDRTALLGMNPLIDQHLGGLLMFGFDNLLMVAFAGHYFMRLFPSDDYEEDDRLPLRHPADGINRD